MNVGRGCPSPPFQVEFDGENLSLESKYAIGRLVNEKRYSSLEIAEMVNISARTAREYAQMIREGVTLHVHRGRPKLLTKVELHEVLTTVIGWHDLTDKEIEVILNEKYKEKCVISNNPEETIRIRHHRMSCRTLSRYVNEIRCLMFRYENSEEN